MTNASTRLRVAVIGAGYVAGHHLSALKRLDFVELVGICDTNLSAAKALADRFGIPLAVSQIGELAAARPQAMHILTPPSSHARLTLEALDMGCGVLVEKPMADTVADCEQMTATAREKGLILGVNHSDLLDPVVIEALAAVRAGKIGEVVSVDVLRSSEYPAYAGGPLPAQVAQGSYPFRDLGVHGLYTLEAFLGPLRDLDVRFQASGRDPNLRYDEWQARASGERGFGRLLLSWNARPMENRLVIRGTAGIVEVDRFLQTCRIHRVLPGPKFIGVVVNSFLSSCADLLRIPWNVARFATGLLKPSPGIQAGAAAFARAARDNGRPPFGGDDALRVLRLLEPACVDADRLRTEELRARYAPLQADRILVTGAAGFLGRALVARLKAEGERLRVLVRRPVREWAGDAQIEQVIGDLGDPDIVDHAVAGARLVYHVGAAMRGGARDFEAGTVWGTRNVVDACLRHDVARLVHVSSLSVLDHAGRDETVKLTENSAYEPHPERRGAYTQSKLAAERLVRTAVAERGLRAVVVRPGQIFGPGAERVTPNGTLAIAGRWIAVGGPEQSLPLVYVDDVIDALLLAATARDAAGGVFNIVDPEAVSQGEYLDRARARLGADLRLVRVPTRAFALLGHAVELLGKLLRRDVPLTRYRVRSLRPLSNFDLSAAREGLHWTPRVGVRRGLDLTFGSRES